MLAIQQIGMRNIELKFQLVWTTSGRPITPKMPEMFCNSFFRDKAKAQDTATGNLGMLGETGNSDTKIRAPKQVGSCQSLQSENVQFSGMHLGNKCVGSRSIWANDTAHSMYETRLNRETK